MLNAVARPLRAGQLFRPRLVSRFCKLVLNATRPPPPRGFRGFDHHEERRDSFWSETLHRCASTLMR